jgi:hypothetical protein
MDRVKALQPGVSNRAIADAMRVALTTIGRGAAHQPTTNMPKKMRGRLVQMDSLAQPMCASHSVEQKTTKSIL